MILLSDMIDNSRAETLGMDASIQEAYFFSKNFLKEYRPTHDDILSGMVDGSRDGGIDSMHIFINGHCIRDDVDWNSLGRNAHIDLVITQVKNAKGFSEAALDKLIIHLPELFDFARDEEVLARKFNPKVIELSRRFLKLYRSLDMPHLRIFVGYAALKAVEAHPNVLAKAEGLTAALERLFSSSVVSVELMNAGEVADLARRRIPTSKELTTAENPISTDTAGGYLCVVSLDEYQRFITDPSGNLDAAMFEANVRDYEGETAVNRSISETLITHDTNIDFWWLNNGVTVVADTVQQSGKLLKLESPQVVNGLQTSHEIFKRPGPVEGDGRSVLVKVIQAAEESVKDRIIKATNSQTVLGLSAVRATDRVQRQIEEHLRSVDLFYERRKNFYHNQSIALNKLVSIDQMGQAVMAIAVQLPHVARGQVSRIFEDEVYASVFDSKHPIEMYSRCLLIVRASEKYLRGHKVASRNMEDYVFHVSMVGACLAARKNRLAASDIVGLNVSSVEAELPAAFKLVQTEFAYVASRKRRVLFDQVAKDAVATERVLDGVRRYLLSSSR